MPREYVSGDGLLHQQVRLFVTSGGVVKKAIEGRGEVRLVIDVGLDSQAPCRPGYCEPTTTGPCAVLESPPTPGAG